MTLALVRCALSRHPVARFVFPARHSSAEEYALCIERVLPSELQRPDVRAGLVEAITNAILHGAFGIQLDSSDDFETYLDAIERAEHKLAGKTLIGVLVCAGEGRADVIVSDFGEGFDWQRATVRCGRGLGILHEVFDSVSWNDGGNSVRLTIVDKESVK